MKPGEMRTFKENKGKAVVVGVGLWAQRQGKWVQIHVTGPDRSHTTVSNNPNSERYHRTLFRNLRNTLLSQNCWPYGDAGAEVEAQPVLEESRFHPVAIRGEGLSKTILSDRGDR